MWSEREEIKPKVNDVGDTNQKRRSNSISGRRNLELGHDGGMGARSNSLARLAMNSKQSNLPAGKSNLTKDALD